MSGKLGCVILAISIAITVLELAKTVVTEIKIFSGKEEKIAQQETKDLFCLFPNKKKGAARNGREKKQCEDTL